MADTPESDTELALLLETIYQKYRYDFRDYTRSSLYRRMQTALIQLRTPTLTALRIRVLREPGFLFELLQYLTVPVTELFREPLFFRLMRDEVIPHLRTYPSLKFWIAGCSTGEEAYSLAILLREEGLLDRSLIYATDINPKSLQVAIEGAYPISLLEKYAENYALAGGKEKLADHYELKHSSFQFLPKLKEHLLFTDHSLATDHVFSEVQFVSCRNVMIYFQKNLQDRTIRLFHATLASGGFLGIGEKESIRISSIAEAFQAMGKSGRIFQKKPVVHHSAYRSRKGQS